LAFGLSDWSFGGRHLPHLRCAADFYRPAKEPLGQPPQ